MNKRNLSPLAVASILLLASCGGGGKSEVDNLPFQGRWHKPGGWYTLDVDRSRVQFIDHDDMCPILMYAPYSPESPDNTDHLTFVYEDQYPGSIVYDRAKQIVTLTIKGCVDDGSDYEIIFEPSDRLDRITPYVAAEYRNIYSLEDNTAIDTLYLGETVKWIDDTLNRHRVLLDDGRRGYVLTETTRPTRGIPTDLAYENTYRYRCTAFTETYSFNRKGDQVIVIFNHVPKDGDEVIEKYYLGDIDGYKINVGKEFATAADASDGNLSATASLEKPFTISVIDNDDNPYIVVNKVAYRMVENH